MATLGEAFIAVKADMSPFRRDLKAEVKAAADSVEKQLGDAISKGLGGTAEKAGEDAGGKAGDGMRKGLKSKLGDKGKPPWIDIVGALGAALDDGISALPAELKAAIVIGIVAALPIISAGLAGALAAGIAVGVAGLGIALASQFDVVQERWNSFLSNTRNALVSTALPFVSAIINALDLAETRIEDLAPTLENIFRGAADFVVPLVDGAIGAIEEILAAIEAEIPNLDQFVKELAAGFKTLGSAIADAMQILIRTGKDGRNGLRDLIFIISAMIVATAQLIAFFTKLYGVARDFFNDIPYWLTIVQPLAAVAKAFVEESDAMAQQNEVTSDSNYRFRESLNAATTALKREEDALKENQKMLEDYIDSQFEAVDSAIDFQEALDDLEASLRENGKTLDITTAEGRENLRRLQDAIEGVVRQDKIRAVELGANSSQRYALMQEELAQIYELARSFGISREAVDKYYGSAIAAFSVPPPNLAWLREQAYLLTLSANEARRYINELWNLPNRPGGPQPFADGGIVYGPTNALIGEAGAEAVIPLTRPARAAQLLQKSGLDRLLFSANSTVVQVFVGNEELDSRTVRVVQQANASQARSLGFGVRT